MIADITDSLISDAIESSTPTKRKRGRPRKNQEETKKKKNKSSDINAVCKEVSLCSDDEIILHLPISMDDVKNLSNIISEGSESINSYRTEDNKSNISSKFTIGGISDSDTESSYDSDSEMLSKIKKLQDENKVLKKELETYKKIIEQNLNSGLLDIKASKMKVNFVNYINGEQFVDEKTDIACWWCTYNFDNVPCFLPEKYMDNTFHVFGCFCSYNCAAAYNIDIDDYRVADRFALLKKLYFCIFKQADEIYIAPPRLILIKFGGKLTIKNYRENSIKNTKEYRLLMPPLKTIVPVIEESFTDNSLVQQIKVAHSKNELVLKRNKKLPNTKTTLFDTLGIKES